MMLNAAALAERLKIIAEETNFMVAVYACSNVSTMQSLPFTNSMRDTALCI